MSTQLDVKEATSMKAISMDGTDPTTWDPALDGVLAAPENHAVLYEDDAIRVISTSPRARSRNRITIDCPQFLWSTGL
jgi:hypothetical protein